MSSRGSDLKFLVSGKRIREEGSFRLPETVCISISQPFNGRITHPFWKKKSWTVSHTQKGAAYTCKQSLAASRNRLPTPSASTGAPLPAVWECLCTFFFLSFKWDCSWTSFWVLTEQQGSAAHRLSNTDLNSLQWLGCLNRVTFHYSHTVLLTVIYLYLNWLWPVSTVLGLFHCSKIMLADFNELILKQTMYMCVLNTCLLNINYFIFSNHSIVTASDINTVIVF